MKEVPKYLLVCLLLFALLISGCSTLGGEKWVAKVNGQIITEEEFENRLNNVKADYKKQGYDLSSEDEATFLYYLIVNEVVNQEVKKLGLNTDDPKVIEQENEIKNSVGGEEAYTEYLRDKGITSTDIRNTITLWTKVTEDVKVTDEQIKTFFEQNQEYFGSQSEQVKARHILVDTEDEAKAIIKELNNGADFIELAKEKSKDGTAPSGGALGYFGKGMMVPEFEKAAFEQKVGTFSQNPIKTEFGYHIILVEDHKAAVKVEFEKVKDQVAQAALAFFQEQKYNEYVNELMSKANIEYIEKFQPANS